jgi:hypothetical protein
MPLSPLLQLAQVGGPFRIRDSTARGNDNLVQAGSHRESQDYTGTNANAAAGEACISFVSFGVKAFDP